MARGGKREGAGRRHGSKNKRSQTDIEAARAEGELPHEFLLRVARGEEIEHHGEVIQPDMEMRMKAAKEAANYYAPRLATIEQKIEAEVDYVISAETLTDEQFEDKYLNGE